ncbi:hypothetical protein DL95DRAFT_393512 [Leptodontidium sp. 2 PMI_412]|nr:hypothetical protein DL95DRAFT_393512 [Leptodontidium sp. 2 PMI_412]
MTSRVFAVSPSNWQVFRAVAIAQLSAPSSTRRLLQPSPHSTSMYAPSTAQ